MLRSSKNWLLGLVLLSVALMPQAWSAAGVCVHGSDEKATLHSDSQSEHHEHHQAAEEAGNERAERVAGCGCGCACVAAACTSAAGAMVSDASPVFAFDSQGSSGLAHVSAMTLSSHDFELIRPPNFS
tara:strand:- start:25592 stop:25975 length:384 start_codon:yes stop_codon:yes gene_type:complete